MSRQTRQRAAIRAALETADRPLTPTEILALATHRSPGLGLATVYRNLRSLAAEGFLRTVRLPEGPDRYEVAGKDHHHHFHCRACDAVFEVESCPGGFSRLAPGGFRLERHEVILFGLCRTCAEERV